MPVLRRIATFVAVVLVTVGGVAVGPAAARLPHVQGLYVGHDHHGHEVTFRVVVQSVWHFHVHGRPAVDGTAEIHHGHFQHCEPDWCFAGHFEEPTVVVGSYWRHEPGHAPKPWVAQPTRR